MKDKDIREHLSCCPYCGSEEYYTVQNASGKVFYRERFDGEEAENGAMYEGLRYKQAGKYAYCCDCNKRLFKLTNEGAE